MSSVSPDNYYRLESPIDYVNCELFFLLVEIFIIKENKNLLSASFN